MKWLSKIKRTVRLILFMPVAWIWLLVYCFSSQREKIDMDLDSFSKVHIGRIPVKGRKLRLIKELISFAEFRSLFLYRIGKKSHFIKYFMPRGALQLGFDVPREKFGGGLFIQHGYCTDLSARAIGEHCWINQRVTLGYKGDECPTIGDHVSIGVGAVVLGGVRIGNNVRIGANAIVVHDVPDNCTVCSPAATIVKKRDSNEIESSL